MQYPYFYMSVPVFIQALHNLKNVLLKGEMYCKARKLSEEVMLNERLIVDMYSLVVQVQVACDNAKGASARLAGVVPPKMEDTEKTFAEIYSRIDKTVLFLKTLKPEQFENSANAIIKLPYFPNKHFLGKDYLPYYALPNFFFHVTTAYNILRHNAVDVGKMDFVGEVEMHDD